MEMWLTLANYGCEELLKTQVSYMSVMITVLVTTLALFGLFIPIWNIDRMEKLKEKTADEIDKLKEEIKEQQKELNEKIEKANQETYSASADIYMDIALVLSKVYKNSIKDVFPDIINSIVVAIQYAIKTKDPDNIKHLPGFIDFVHTILKYNQTTRKDIDNVTIELLQILMQDDAIKNDKTTYQKCIEIIYWVNEAHNSVDQDPASGGSKPDKPE